MNRMKKGDRLTTVLRNGGFNANFKFSFSIEL